MPTSGWRLGDFREGFFFWPGLGIDVRGVGLGGMALLTVPGLLQGLGHAALEGVHQGQDGHFFWNGRGQAAALQLGLNERPQLLGGVVAVVGPEMGWQATSIGEKKTSQVLFVRGSRRGPGRDNNASPDRSCSG